MKNKIEEKFSIFIMIEEKKNQLKNIKLLLKTLKDFRYINIHVFFLMKLCKMLNLCYFTKKSQNLIIYCIYQIYKNLKF